MLGIGVTDHFSIAGGVSVVPGAGSRVMIISSAYTPVRAGDLDLSCGLFYMKKTGGRGTPIPYVNATYGDAGLSATLGSGWRPGGGDGQGTLFFIGGFLLPLGDDTELISDFIAPPNADPAVVSLGTRVHANKLTAEFALIVPWNVRGTPGVPLPWTSVSIEF
ncbi:MAG TPA: hypothetical protein VJO14_02225 [Bacteroidota bacterium]|nr:hypothetical protein [Bacteroidota bacterium]